MAPSILSADFARLGAQVGEVLDAGARVIHVDVMDGHFVPSITLGPIVVAALREQVERVGGLLDVHLMIERPERHIAEFLQAGAHSITFHAEGTPHVAYAAALVREGGASVGVAINPATPVGAVAELTDAIDLALCMTVNPGWGDRSSSPTLWRRSSVCATSSAKGSPWRSTAASIPLPPAQLERREPTCSWPARPCLGRPTQPPHTEKSPRRPERSRALTV